MATSNKPPAPPLARRLWDTGFPVTVVLLVLLVVWYGAAWGMNANAAIERVLEPTGNPWTWQDPIRPHRRPLHLPP